MSPVRNANFAWVQYVLHFLVPTTDTVGLVLESGTISSNQSCERQTGTSLIKADFVDHMVAVPGHFFRCTWTRVWLRVVSGDCVKGKLRDLGGEVCEAVMVVFDKQAHRLHDRIVDSEHESHAVMDQQDALHKRIVSGLVSPVDGSKQIGRQS